MAPHGPDSGAREAALRWAVADGADRLGGGLYASSSSSERRRRLTRPRNGYVGQPRSNPMEEEAALLKKGGDETSVQYTRGSRKRARSPSGDHGSRS